MIPFVSAPLKVRISENTSSSCPLAMHFAINLTEEEAAVPCHDLLAIFRIEEASGAERS
jgi:hypothetical protein